MNSFADVVILGGGVIGLASAVELARRGAAVTVLERAAPGGEASWAAAGMLMPYSEGIEDAALRALAVESLDLYPAFARMLADVSGVDVKLRLDGSLNTAIDAASTARLAQLQERLVREGRRARMVSAREAAVLENALGAGLHGALVCEDEGQVDNRRLVRALIEAARRLGVDVRCEIEVEALECSARRVLGVRTARGFLAAGSVVNALGAWAGALGGVPADLRVPVVPVKGQMLALAMPAKYLTRVVWSHGVYAVPRGDGRLIIGATVEHAGFDRRLTAGGVRRLLDGAVRALPGTAAFALSETWAGLRPGTPDGLPYLGATRLDGYVLATGHYRNGILLSPVTARLVADVIEGLPVEAGAFAIERGGPESRAAFAKACA